MRDTCVTTEIWGFQCQRCERRWEEVYEAWHANDGHGGDAVTWRYHGIVCCPPWCDPTCPSCGGLGAKVLPSHWHDQDQDQGHAHDHGPGREPGHGYVPRPRRSA
jgi:hypothetical protein